MDDELNKLKNTWKDIRKSVEIPEISVDKLVKTANKKKRETMRMHVLNVLVLSITLAGVSAFFIYVAKLNQLISHIGIVLMIGGLALRITIELFSIYLSAKIDLSDTTLRTNSTFLGFYRFRKKIHGPVTLTILVLYTVGFYMLTPEFSLYFNLPMMVLIDTSYIIAAIIFTWNIRNAIKKEMGYLNEIKRVHNEITGFSE